MTLTVVNEEGLLMRKTMSISVEEEEGFPTAMVGSIGAVIILLIIALVLFMKKREKEPETMDIIEDRASQQDEKSKGEGTDSVEWEMPKEEDTAEDD